MNLKFIALRKILIFQPVGYVRAKKEKFLIHKLCHSVTGQLKIQTQIPEIQD
jgi:hypothetical protein